VCSWFNFSSQFSAFKTSQTVSERQGSSLPADDPPQKKNTSSLPTLLLFAQLSAPFFVCLLFVVVLVLCTMTLGVHQQHNPRKSYSSAVETQQEKTEEENERQAFVLLARHVSA
jgi:uncharacterized protein HemX